MSISKPELRVHDLINRMDTNGSKVRQKSRNRKLFAMLSVIPALVLLTANPARAVHGGAPASKPWVVRIIGITQNSDGSRTRGTCSGVALNDLLIVTAEHCKADTVSFLDGTDVSVASRDTVPKADMQVLSLSSSHHLAEYPTLGPDRFKNYSPIPAGTLGTNYGYGYSAGLRAPYQQRALSFKVEAYGTNDAGAEVIRVIPRLGFNQRGDSGGPAMIDGFLVGIVTRQYEVRADGTQVMDVYGISNAFSTIHELQHHREMRSITESSPTLPWVSAVKVENGTVSFTMSTALINSGRRVVAWIDGKYLGEVRGNQTNYAYSNYYYNGKENINGGAIYRMGGWVVRANGLVQIGIVTGENKPEAAELLYETPITGIKAVKIENQGALDVSVSNELLNADHRIVVWLNGKYLGELNRDPAQSYYATKQNITDGARFRLAWLPVQYGDLVQIGIVTGTNSPEASALIYESILSGIESMNYQGGYLGVTVASSLINSGQRIAFWYNGRYVAEIANTTIYRSWAHQVSEDSVRIIPTKEFTPNSLVQIGIVDKFWDSVGGTPDDSKLLFDSQVNF
jgi:hypothetical protein